MFDSDFDNWIEFYYYMDELQELMNEEERYAEYRTLSMVIQGKKKLDSLYVEDCLDELDAIIRANRGKLPKTPEDCQKLSMVIQGKRKLDSLYVEECLDGLDAIMSAHGGKLPITPEDCHYWAKEKELAIEVQWACLSLRGSMFY